MTFDEMFPNKWMKASDLPEEGSLTLTIDSITIEEIGKEQKPKPILHFSDHEKPMVCNVTNGNIIRSLHGKDPDDWIGKQISLHRMEVESFGETVEAIRVRLRPAKPAAKPTGKNPERPELDDNEIPF